MRNLRSSFILSIVAISVFLIFPGKSFAGFSCSASGNVVTFSLTGCPNPGNPALWFKSLYPAPPVSSTYAFCYYPAYVYLPSPGYYTFDAYDGNGFSYGGCGVSYTLPPQPSAPPPPPPSAPAPAPAPGPVLPVPPPPPYLDLGLRMFDGLSIIKIAAEPQGTVTSPLRIAKNGIVYGISLVDITDPNASRMRVKTSGGIKAVRKY